MTTPANRRARRGAALAGRVKALELQEYALAIVVVLLFVVGAILKPDTFPTWDNVRNMLTQASVVGVLAIGMTFVIATAGIDLSVGSIVAAAGVFGGILVGDDGTSSLLFIVGAIAFATPARDRQRDRDRLRASRAVHRDAGDVLDRPGPRAAPERQAAGEPARPERRLVRQPARRSRCSGSATAGSSGSRPPSTSSSRSRSPAGSSSTAPATAATSWRSAATARPRGSPASRSGRIIFSVYVLSGLLAGVAAVLLCARLGSASPVSGNLYELDAIGAVVIGGTSLAGGRATIVGTFLGVLTFALIFSLMTQLNLSTEVQQVTKGLIVLGAVLLQRPEARY